MVSILLILILGAADTSSQVIKPPLTIGDTIPESLWHTSLQVVNHPEGKNTITLNDYRGKLIVLDFWATWCSGCIAAMPKNQKLEQEFMDKVVFIPVTGEPGSKVSFFLSRNPTIKGKNIFSVVSDNLLRTFFLHRLIPHYVWIKDGALIAMTGTDDVTDSTVGNVLAGFHQKNTLKLKKDLDIQKPLFMSEDFNFGDSLLAYSIFLKGAYSGLPSGNHRILIKGAVRGHASTNLPILDIYISAVIPIFRQLGDRYSTKRTIIEVQDSKDIQLQYIDSSSFSTCNLFNYELIVPQGKADSIPLLMLKELNRYSSYTGSVERRLIKCFVLIKTGTSEVYKTKGGPARNTIGGDTGPFVLSNLPVRSLVSRLDSDPSLPLPVIDKTGVTCNIDLTLSGNKSLPSLRAELQRYGLDLIEQQEQLNMFVIKDKVSRSSFQVQP